MVDVAWPLTLLAAIACSQASRDPVGDEVANDAASDHAPDRVATDGPCDCSQAGSCPSQAEFEAQHCGGAYVTRIRYEGCPYLEVRWSSTDNSWAIYYGPDGSVVGKRGGNAFMDIYSSCGDWCGGLESASCTVCGGSVDAGAPPPCNDG